MRHGHAGDDADIRTADVGQAGDVSGAPGTHLQDDPIDVIRGIEQRQRETQLVVEGPLAGGHAERRRQARTEQILGRRLPDRARNANDSALHPVACDRAQAEEGLGGVLDDDRRCTLRFPRREVGRGTPFESVADELVPVALGDDGNVELSRLHRPGVDARARHGDIGSDLLPTETGGEFRNGESHASRSRPIV